MSYNINSNQNKKIFIQDNTKIKRLKYNKFNFIFTNNN
jgi:hypothetical protein